MARSALLGRFGEANRQSLPILLIRVPLQLFLVLNGIVFSRAKIVQECVISRSIKNHPPVHGAPRMPRSRKVLLAVGARIADHSESQTPHNQVFHRLILRDEYTSDVLG